MAQPIAGLQPPGCPAPPQPWPLVRVAVLAAGVTALSL